MCRAISLEDRSSDDETNDHLYYEDEDAGELQYRHQLKKSMIIDYIMSLGGNQNDPFVSPVMALKIIDFCFLIINRTNITKKNAEQLTRRWYRINASEQVTASFHQRVKSVDEIIKHLIEDLELKTILSD